MFSFARQHGSGDGHQVRWALLMLGAALWLISHPYWGIWHDARVYTLMAVRWLSPQAYVRDPWFMFGSQDDFTLFSPLYGSTIAWLGVESAAKAWTLGLGLFFVAASYAFSRSVSRSHFPILFLLMVGVPWIYCVNSYNVLHEMRVSESFVTSRHFAVSLSLLGVAAAINGRLLWSALWFLVGLAIHPLIAIWPILAFVAVSSRLPAISLLILAGIGVATSLCLAWFEIGIFRHLAGGWSEYVRKTAVIVFPYSDGRHRLEFAALVYAILACGIRWGSPLLRPWYFSVLAIAVSAYAVFWFCSAFAPSVIIMQIQPWRANWLALFFALVAVLDLSVRGANLSLPRRVLTIGAWAAGLAGGWSAVFFLLGWAMIPARFLSWSRSVIGSQHRKSVLHGVWLIFGLTLFFRLLSTWLDIQMLVNVLPPRLFPDSEWLTNLLWAFALSGASVIVVGFVLYRVGSRMGAVISAIVLVTALLVWDQAKVSRYQDANGVVHSRNYPLFNGLVKPGDTVYWQNRPDSVWYLLGTASYASSVQAIGIVFSENMTFELARRLQRVALADVGTGMVADGVAGPDLVLKHLRLQGKTELRNLHSYEANTMTEAGLRFLCADPELDFVVHDQNFHGYVRATEFEILGGRRLAWNLYDCRRIRAIR